VSPDVVENACPISGTYRVIEQDPEWFNNLCSHCFAGVDSVEDIPDDWELCRSTSNARSTLHRTRRDAGDLVQEQDDYSGYSQPCAILDRMSVEEFDERIGGGA